VLNAFTVLGDGTANECWSAYAEKLTRLSTTPDSFEALRTAWPAMQRTLDELLSPLPPLVLALREAGCPLRFGDLASHFSADTATWAVTHGHHMRDRFVISDLVEMVGLWNDDFIGSVLEDLEDMGVGR
jgi:glycerol-1-phosphate dehydrogenase [NAD(P)+]